MSILTELTGQIDRVRQTRGFVEARWQIIVSEGEMQDLRAELLKMTCNRYMPQNLNEIYLLGVKVVQSKTSS